MSKISYIKMTIPFIWLMYKKEEIRRLQNKTEENRTKKNTKLNSQRNFQPIRKFLSFNFLEVFQKSIPHILENFQNSRNEMWKTLE